MLTPDQTVLVVVDIQDKLWPHMQDQEDLLQQALRMVHGVRALDLPVLWTEQYPEGLGPTVPPLQEALQGLTPISKRSFSCCGESAFRDHLERLGRRQVLLCGIETHVCVYQTAMDLCDRDYTVQIVADAVSSRSARNRDIGFRRCEAAGATLTGVETALLELVRRAEGPLFKQVLKLIK